MSKEQGAIPIERTVLEQKEQLFRQIESAAPGDQMIAFLRVLEHSVEDGLRLGERLRLTPQAYLMATSSVTFGLKHARVSKKIQSTPVEGTSDLENTFVHTREFLNKCVTSDSELTELGEKKLKEETSMMQRVPIIQAIDALYVDILMQRPAPHIKEKKQPISVSSQGERMGERYLQDVEEVLERRYYSNPVKAVLITYDKDLIQDPLFQQPNIKESDLSDLCEIHGLDFQVIKEKLRKDIIVAFREIDSVKRRVVQNELKREIEAELPATEQVQLDENTNIFRIVNKELNEQEPKQEEGLSAKERLAAFEKKGLDMVEVALEDPKSDKNHLARMLAGCESVQSWDMRERLIRDPNVLREDILCGLAGCESSKAWAMRERLEKDGASKDYLMCSLAGCDSPKAWFMRQRLIPGGDNFFILLSIKGCDSLKAWAIRERIENDKLISRTDILESLAGCESPKAWAMREKYGNDNYGILKSLVGCHSPRAWALREELEKSGNAQERALLVLSLAGLNEERADEMSRRLFVDLTIDRSYFISSFAGRDSNIIRNICEQAIDDLGVESTSVNTAESYLGDLDTFMWRKNVEKQSPNKKNQEKTETIQERIAAIEKKGLDIIEKLLDDPAFEDSGMVTNLAGCESQQAWALRNWFEFISRKSSKQLLLSLRGCDSPRAWAMRERISKDGNFNDQYMINSLYGCDSPKAWAMRETYAREQAFADGILFSLNEIDSQQAWDMRERLEKAGASHEKSFIVNLGGCDSPKAWDMRNRLKDKVSSEELLQSLNSCDSPRAWAMRDKLENVMEKEAYNIFVCLGLRGCDSPRAWAMRKRLVSEGVPKDILLSSLAGIDSNEAEDFRADIVVKFNLSNTYEGLITSYLSASNQFLWRKNVEKNSSHTKNQENTQSPSITTKLGLLNLVHNPELKEIQSYWKKHPQQPSVQENPFITNVLMGSFADKESAKVMLKTNAAVIDRAPERLAQELIRRILPQRKTTESLFDRAKSLFGGERSSEPRSSIVEQDSYTNRGGGSKELNDTRRILESRDPMQELLVQGIYGKYNPVARQWNKSYFSVKNQVQGPTKETTLTLDQVSANTRVQLPVPLTAMLVTERVKGVTTSGKTISLEVSTNSLGESTVLIPHNVERMHYSIAMPLAPEPMYTPEAKEFRAFVKNFKTEYGTDMTERLARLPQDIEAMLHAASFKQLDPKAQVQAIESLVRTVGWYDVHNEVTEREKFNATPEERILICEERMEQIRRDPKQKKTQDKRFAGVCTDFAEITCAALRLAGFPSGIMKGLDIRGKEAHMKDAHAVAFVAWPDGKGGTRIQIVDGTPNGTTPETQNIALSTIQEREQQMTKEVKADIVEAQQVVAEALAAAQANDESALKLMQNGRLERALNLILHHEVKATHLKAIEDMLNVYWYGGIEKQEAWMGDVALREAFEGAIASQRKYETQTVSDEKAGSKLLELVREFVTKLQKKRKLSRTESFEVFQHLADLASGELMDVERRALTVAIAYLKAEKL